MPGGVYVEENNKYKIDCTNAIWSTDQIHFDYVATHSLLSDVDFVIETEDIIYLVEYKNSNLPYAANPDAFQPNTQKKVEKIARKYYDSLHYLKMHDSHKPVKYIYVVDYPNAGQTDRMLLRDKITDLLPFQLQIGSPIKLISGFDVLSIDEWNAHSEYSRFPLIPVQAT
jgi:hypothetical protein